MHPSMAGIESQGLHTLAMVFAHHLDDIGRGPCASSAQHQLIIGIIIQGQHASTMHVHIDCTTLVVEYMHRPGNVGQ